METMTANVSEMLSREQGARWLPRAGGWALAAAAAAAAHAVGGGGGVFTGCGTLCLTASHAMQSKGGKEREAEVGGWVGGWLVRRPLKRAERQTQTEQQQRVSINEKE